MNQKLHTYRCGIVILFALLCIVCLSLSLVLSAHFAAYAAEENAITELPEISNGQPLWLVYYEGQTEGESLWNGIHDGEAIYYLDAEGNVAVGKADEEYCYTPFRGEDITITLKLNPNYEIEGKGKLSELYNLSENSADENRVRYLGNSDTGKANQSYFMPTTVVAKPLSDSEGAKELRLEKNWTIATLCNVLEGAPNDYIGNGGVRAYGSVANYNLLEAVKGDTVVYELTSNGQEVITVAVRHEQNGVVFLQAGKEANGRYFVAYNDEGVAVPWNQAELDQASKAGLNLINHKIRSLNVLQADSEYGIEAYKLTIVAMPIGNLEDNGIYYAQSSKSYQFDVIPQSLGTESESDETFVNNFKYSIGNNSVEYTKSDEWLEKIGFNLWLGKDEDNSRNILLQNLDYTISVESKQVGSVDLIIYGSGNISGTHIIKDAVRINPAHNTWAVNPNIIAWTYGTYKPANNVIVGMPTYIDDYNDITFKIVKLVKDNQNNVIEQEIDHLTNIHYLLEDHDGVVVNTGYLENDAIAALEKLGVGDYRLYASVYGSYSTDEILARNYEPINASVDFKVFMGNNTWKDGDEPQVKNGGWTEGKLETTDGLINAASVLGKVEETILMIYKVGENGDKDVLVYSNIHPDSEYGNIEVLKSLKAGRYYLSAEVKATDNYTGLKTTVLFTVNPNRLPTWAVILIVVGSLGLVALVFSILHQKGILQMLTGKVIVSMRTRANVDATLAAIRAAKVAREAEASIAAAKAREEEAKAEKPEDK